METVSHIVTTEYRIDVRDTPIDELVAVKASLNGEASGLSFCIERKRWEDLKRSFEGVDLYKEVTTKLDDQAKWYLVNPAEFWPSYRKDELLHKNRDAFYRDVFLSLDHGHFDPDRLCQVICLSYATKWGDEYPVSPGIRVQYSVEEEYFDLDKAQAILEADERVWTVKRSETTPYSCCEPATEYIEFYVRLEQDVFNEMVDILRSRERQPNSWWLNAQYAFGCKKGVFVPSEFDPLGLNAARKEE